jgi:hypothetical protein
MRRLIVMSLAMALAFAACAAAPEDPYWAERDAGIAKVKALEATKHDDAKAQAADEEALAALQKRLVAIVGPIAVRGYAKTPKINLETLSQEGMGVNMLDGLAFAPEPDPQDGSVLIVTTPPLLERWLKDRAAETDAAFRTPVKAEEALREDHFYTFAFGSDAAFGWAAEIDIAKPAGADYVLAGVGRRAQVDDPSPVDRLVVTVFKSGRALIAETAMRVKIPEFPACKSIWDKALARSQTLSKAYAEGGSKDETLDKASLAATEDGSRAWLACVGERAKQTPLYSAVKKQAQELAARLAGG